MGNIVTRTTVLSSLWYIIVVALPIVLVAIFVSLTDIVGHLRGVGIVLSRFLGVPIDLGIVAVLSASLIVLTGIVLFVVLWRPPGRLSRIDAE